MSASSLHIPNAMLATLKSVAGFDESFFMDAHNQPAPVSVRVHPGKMEDAAAHFGKDLVPVPWCDTGWYLPGRPRFTLDPLLHAGAYYVQEASSMFLQQVWQAIPVHRQPLRLVDLCAAPGGKSTHLASLAAPGSVLVSNEVIQPRNAILVENLTKWGGSHTLITQSDPRDFGRLGPWADVMLVDAPCSGSGLWRRDPQTVQTWSEETVSHCAARQKRILTDAWPVLKPGGYLIYATCSYSPQENEDLVDWMAESLGAKGMQVATEAQWGIAMTLSPQNGLPGYRFFPGWVQGEGLYMALLQKPGPPLMAYPHIAMEKLSSKKPVPEPIASWLNAQASVIGCLGDHHVLQLLSPACLHAYSEIKKYLYVKQAGIRAAEIIRNKANPLHGLATSGLLDPNCVPQVPMNHSQALGYLRKEPIEMPEAHKGWMLATYQGLGLGWLKNLGNRINNYYPVAWRIRLNE